MNLSLALILGLAVSLATGVHWGLLTTGLIFLGLEHWRLRRRVAELEVRLREGMDYLPDLVNQMWDLRQKAGTPSAASSDTQE